MKKFIFLIIPIIIIVFIIVFQKIPMPFVKNEPTNIKYSISINSGEKIYTYQNTIYVYSKSGLKIYENDNQILEETFALENPFIISSDDKILLGDKYGKILRIFNSKNNLYTINNTNPIMSATINKNGYSALISKNNSYYEVLVFDEVGNTVLILENITYKEGIPVNLTLSNDNKCLAVNFVKTDGAVVESNISIYSLSTNNDTTNNSMFSAFKKPNQMAGIIKFLNNKNLLILSDKEFSIISVKENVKQADEIIKLPFNNKIEYMSFLNNSGFALVYGDEILQTKENKISPNTVIIYNYSGGKIGNISQKENSPITDIFSNENGIIIAQDRLFTGYSLQGKKIFEYHATQDINSFQFFSSKDKAIITTENEIKVFKINKKIINLNKKNTTEQQETETSTENTSENLTESTTIK